MLYSQNIDLYSPPPFVANMESGWKEPYFDPWYFFGELPNPLTLSGSAHLRDEDLIFLQYAVNITALKIIDCEELTDKALSFLPTSLKSLTIQKCPGFTDEGIKMLSFLPYLTTLSFIECSGISGETFSYLPSSLKKLSLRKCIFLSDTSLAFLPNLYELSIDDCRYLTGNSFPYLPLSLTKLFIRKAPLLVDKAIEGLVFLQKLQSLTIANCPKFYGYSVGYLSATLTHLTLAGSHNYYAIKSLAALKNLSYLNAVDTRVTDLDLPFLESLGISEIILRAP